LPTVSPKSLSVIGEVNIKVVSAVKASADMERDLKICVKSSVLLNHLTPSAHTSTARLLTVAKTPTCNTTFAESCGEVETVLGTFNGTGTDTAVDIASNFIKLWSIVTIP
jgi:hypothetical protein